jgi:diguanylate cyclase (GGDEF)-like protein/PAS domain S-box-containing protein
MRVDSLRVRNIFLQLFTVPAVLLLGVSFWMFQIDSDNRLELIQQNARLNVSKQHDLFEREFSVVVGDLIFLSRLHSMGDLLSPPATTGADPRRVLAGDFKLFAEQKSKYDQIRYLDNNGMELVRVNYRNGEADIVGKNALQSKKRRYYFEESLRLNNGEVFVSPLDLNVEHGKIEQPFKPMIRLATPVFDGGGGKRGIVVLNYLAANLFTLIDKAGAATTSTSMMLNADGYWLKGEKPEDEWGFMLADRQHRTMGKVYPRAWSKIQHEEAGQFMTREGLFTFITVAPSRLDSTGHIIQDRISDPQQSWKIVLHTPTSTLRESAWGTLPRYIVSTVLLLAGWALACFFLSRGRALREMDQRRMDEKDERMRNIVSTAFDSIITINERGIIETFNPAACRLFGYLEHEVIGRKVNVLMPSPDKEYHDMYIQRYIETGEGKIIQRPTVVRGLKRNGSTFSMVICVGAKKVGDNWMFTGICRDNTERYELEKKLEEMAVTDALTGVYNREYFIRRISDEFNRARRYRMDLSVVILDIGYIKEINDQYGHPEGDSYLVQFAAVLQQAVRGFDVVARYSGAEFVLILPQTDMEHALEITERIRVAVSTMEIEHQERSIRDTLTAGAASLLDCRATSDEELLQAADQALYLAKKQG